MEVARINPPGETREGFRKFIQISPPLSPTVTETWSLGLRWAESAASTRCGAGNLQKNGEGSV